MGPPCRLIVVTGGPGAGKTALLEMVRRHFCDHVGVLRESAGIVFGGGFPRGKEPVERRAAQRAIYHVQEELERLAIEQGAWYAALCDRGTLDGAAYWPGPHSGFFEQLATSPARELARYQTVIHLRTPHDGQGYDHSNPLRVESAREAVAIDERIAQAWRDHPRRFIVDHTTDFRDKMARALDLIERELPSCPRCGAVRRPA